MSSMKPKTLGRMKDDAKKLAKANPHLTHSQALKLIAQDNQHANWKAALKTSLDENTAKRRTPPISPTLLTELAQITGLDETNLDERIEDLPIAKKIEISKNKTYLASLGIEFSIFEPTRTGLVKSILDATLPVRAHFEAEKFHFYSQQSKGKEHKVLKTANFVTTEGITKTKVSLYRPETKDGDPRMWFSKLGDFAHPTEQIAIIVIQNELYLINFSQNSLNETSSNSPENAIKQVISLYLASKNTVSNQLLSLLREIAKKPIVAISKGDTAVGMAVEFALGIKANSNKNPDYLGIEIKSGRGHKNRSTLFAQVAEWSSSVCKSSADILDKYGYLGTKGDKRLYCTISTQKPNSQGLQFQYDDLQDKLIEKDREGKVVAVWPGVLLRRRLVEKHSETFWIQASSTLIDGIEHFQLLSVTHTKQPLESQFLPLIHSGVITMDHLIKRKTGNLAVSEKGPLFKINKNDLSFLFPKPVTYSLLQE